MTISDLYFVSKQLVDFTTNSGFENYMNSLHNSSNQIYQIPLNANQQQLMQLQQQRNQQQPLFQSIIKVVEQLILIANTFQFNTWKTEQIELLEKLDYDAILGTKGKQRLESFIINARREQPSVKSDIEAYYNDYTRFKNSPSQLKSILTSLKLNIEDIELGDEEGIIEITFSNKVDVNNFTDAREQMSDWFFIFEGYARLLDVRNEDFEIISIIKQSPTKVKVKTALKHTISILTIISSILVIERSIIERQHLIEQLKIQSITSDKELQNKLVEQAESELQKDIDNKIEKLVDEKLKEHGIDIEKDAKGDVKSSLKKGIHNQYSFIVNGGDVKIQIGDGNYQAEVASLETKKEDVKKLKKSLSEIKALTSPDNETNGDNISNEENNIQ